MLLKTLLIFCVKCEQFADLCLTFSNIRALAHSTCCAKEGALNGLYPPLSFRRHYTGRPIRPFSAVANDRIRVSNGTVPGMAPKTCVYNLFSPFCASSLSCMFCLISHHGNVHAIEGHSHTHTQTHACPLNNII